MQIKSRFDDSKRLLYAPLLRGINNDNIQV